MNMQYAEACFATNGIVFPATANGETAIQRRTAIRRLWIYVNARPPRIVKNAVVLFTTELITIVPAHWLMETIGLIS